MNNVNNTKTKPDILELTIDHYFIYVGRHPAAEIAILFMLT